MGTKPSSFISHSEMDWLFWFTLGMVAGSLLTNIVFIATALGLEGKR